MDIFMRSDKKNSKALFRSRGRTLQRGKFQKSTDVDGDGLSEMKSSEYKDNKLFNAVLWLGALEALGAMAEYRKETGFLKEVNAELKKARASTEQQFWNAQLGCYQYNSRNQDIMGDAMIGQRFVDVTGLPPGIDS